MKHKVPNAETLEITKTPELDIPLTTKPQLRKYLMNRNIEGILLPDYKKIYKFVKSSLSAGLSERQKQEPMLAVFIERIARIEVFLEMLERMILEKDKVTDKAQPIRVNGVELDYNNLQNLHLKCTSAFVNLKFALDVKKKVTTLDRIRQEIQE